MHKSNLLFSLIKGDIRNLHIVHNDSLHLTFQIFDFLIVGFQIGSKNTLFIHTPHLGLQQLLTLLQRMGSLEHGPTKHNDHYQMSNKILYQLLWFPIRAL